MTFVNFKTMTDREFVNLVHELYHVRGNVVSVEARIFSINGEKYTASVGIADNGDLCDGIICNKNDEDVTLASSQF